MFWVDTISLLQSISIALRRRVICKSNCYLITLVVASLLLKQDEYSQLECRRMFSAESPDVILVLEEMPTQPSLE